MTTYSTSLADGTRVEYRDRKRYLWLVSVLLPLEPLVGIALHAATAIEWLLAAPLIATFTVGPILDWLVGEDRNNPPEAIIMQLDRDRYYRYLTYAVVPLHFIALIGSAAYVAFAGLGPLGAGLLALQAGAAGGLAINTGHELGHKNSRLEKRLSKLVLAIPAYGHFAIDHNLGHHRDVATPEDPASARMGETIYRFALREIPGAVQRAWHEERDRLRRRGRSAWHPANRILQSQGLSALLAIILVLSFGWVMLPFLFLHHLFAYWLLTSANYVEHYGLLRTRLPDGRYERCEPRHSWNSNHLLSNLVLFHLERHSDHHANPLRRYQSLRNIEGVPSLPCGYFGAYLLAWIPPLWFRVMDRRLLALPDVAGNLECVNTDPLAAPSLFLRYGGDRMREPTIDLSRPDA